MLEQKRRNAPVTQAIREGQEPTLPLAVRFLRSVETAVKFKDLGRRHVFDPTDVLSELKREPEAGADLI